MITLKELMDNKTLGRFVSNHVYNWDDQTREYLLRAGYKNYFNIHNDTVYTVDNWVPAENPLAIDNGYPILRFPKSLTPDRRMECYEELMWIMDSNIMITMGAFNTNNAVIFKNTESIEKKMKAMHEQKFEDTGFFYILNNNDVIKKYISNRDILKSLGNDSDWYHVFDLHNLKDITLFTLEYKKQNKEIYDVWSERKFSSKKSSKDMFSCLNIYKNNIVFVVDLSPLGNLKYPNFFYTRMDDKSSYTKLIQHINNEKKYLVIMFNYDFFEKIHGALQYNMSGIENESIESTGEYRISIPSICRRISEEMYGKKAFTRNLTTNKN